MLNMLLRTPLPIPGESYRGYVFRLAEANGLRDSNEMLRHATGIEEIGRLVEHPVEIITGLTGHDASMFSHMKYRTEDHSKSQLNGHLLPKTYLRLRNAKLCPTCVSELGYLPAEWDLLAATTCHRHQIKLLTRCPNCRKQLSWNRPGLLTCKCKANLEHRFCELAESEDTEFAKIITAIMHGTQLKNADSKVGMPLFKLSSMTLRSFLGVSHSLGALRMFLNDSNFYYKGGTDDKEVYEAARIYKDWPINFEKLLNDYGTKFAEQSFGLHRQFTNVTSKLFHMGYPEEDVQFLRKAFVDFGQATWGKAQVDKRLIDRSGCDGNQQYIGINAYAKLIGISVTAVRKMIKDKTLITKTLTNKISERQLILVNLEDIPLKNHEGTLNLREAAHKLGLTKELLKELQEAGVYTQKHHPKNMKGYAIPDLILFNEKVIENQQPSHQMTGGLSSLSTLLRKVDYKYQVELFKRVLDQTLAVYGPSDEIGHLRITPLDYVNYLLECHGFVEGFMTLNDVSLFLHCSLTVVLALYRSDLIKGLKTDKFGLVLDRKGVIDFDATYISIYKLAVEVMGDDLEIRSLANRIGINFLTVQKASEIRSFSFIKRSDQVKLLERA